MPTMDERTPLLHYQSNASFSGSQAGPGDREHDHHSQFCQLIGVRPVNHPTDDKHKPHPDSLYHRAVQHRTNQNRTYMFTATLVNTLLLTQVVLGAALTGLGATNSSRILVTVFGALNTVIAGVVAFLKSRGQPMRARMFRDDLDRVVDEIENSAVMWYGISKGLHGYDAIDTDDSVTVRGEVARLTRLYDRAVKTNTMNDPDMYSGGSGMDSYSAGLRKGPPPPGPSSAPAAPPAATPAATPATPAPILAPVAEVDDPDEEGPASQIAEPAKPKEDSSKNKDTPASESSSGTKASTPAEKKDETAPAAEAPKAPEAATPPAPPAPAPAPISDPDESPATAVHFPKRENSRSSNDSPPNGKT